MNINSYAALVLLYCLFACGHLWADGPYQGNGVKVGEVRADSAILWGRTTSVKNGDPRSQRKAAPGVSGELRVVYGLHGDGPLKRQSEWVRTGVEGDHTHQFHLKDLQAGSTYTYRMESRQSGSDVIAHAVEGQFKTAPQGEDPASVLATFVTCQGMGTVDDSDKGHLIYRDMKLLKPDFFVHTGDVVYYDKDYKGKTDPINVQELSKNVQQARQRWNRMFSYLWNRDFSAHVPSYFMKDDHDTLANDCYPGQSYGDLSFSEGVRIFAEQTPMSSMPYRRFRWGADLEIWLLEGRDFRSPNRSKDGPEKSILGEKQKAWLKEGLRTSNATFKLVISPGPVVGPDKAGKKDNHSNHVFQHEGDELRSFLASIPGALVVCGDRHWQYSSIDPKTGLREFGTGSINRAHDFGGATGFDPKYHRYWSRKGGYLSVLVEREAEVPSISFRYHDIDAAVQGEGEKVPISHREKLYLRDGEWVSDLVEAVVDVDEKPHRKRKLKTPKKKNKKDKP